MYGPVRVAIRNLPRESISEIWMYCSSSDSSGDGLLSSVPVHVSQTQMNGSNSKPY